MKKFGIACGVNMDLRFEIEYLPAATKDLDEIADYLSQFYENTFPKFMTALRRQIAHLREMPHIGVKYKDFRRLVVLDYLVFYQVDEDKRVVTICAILHGAQDLQNRLLK